MTTTEHPRIAWKRGKSRVLHGDCLDELKRLPDHSVDSIVTDPPYGLSTLRPDAVADVITRWASGERDYMPQTRGFMGRSWDGFVPPPAVWDECLRVLKPGGHMAVFAGARTVDLMGISIRLAGFEIRDTLGWLYGSGFLKSINVGRAVEEVEAKGNRVPTGGRDKGIISTELTDDERRFCDWIRDHGGLTVQQQSREGDGPWAGWGTALKPAIEPIILARKPLVHSTVAANVLEHGTGAINTDACRVGSAARPIAKSTGEVASQSTSMSGPNTRREVIGQVEGRFPANVIIDEHAAAVIDQQSGTSKSRRAVLTSTPGGVYANGKGLPSHTGVYGHDDEGGASRFFYCAKASKRERPTAPDGTKHPTVKPLSLITWLLKLITPPGGVVLDPFGGSGTTAEAALLQCIPFVTIERDPAYIPLILSRLERSTPAKKSA